MASAAFEQRGQLVNAGPVILLGWRAERLLSGDQILSFQLLNRADYYTTATGRGLTTKFAKFVLAEP